MVLKKYAFRLLIKLYRTMAANRELNMPHNGHLLAKVMAEKRFTHAQLARALNTPQMTIKRFTEKQSIKSNDLWNLGVAMDVNFFILLAQYHPVQNGTEKEIALQQQVYDLQKEVAIYKDLLKK